MIFFIGQLYAPILDLHSKNWQNTHLPIFAYSYRVFKTINQHLLKQFSDAPKSIQSALLQSCPLSTMLHASNDEFWVGQTFGAVAPIHPIEQAFHSQTILWLNVLTWRWSYKDSFFGLVVPHQSFTESDSEGFVSSFQVNSRQSCSFACTATSQSYYYQKCTRLIYYTWAWTTWQPWDYQ